MERVSCRDCRTTLSEVGQPGALWELAELGREQDARPGTCPGDCLRVVNASITYLDPFFPSHRWASRSRTCITFGTFKHTT